jgi:cysteine synthase A
MRRFLAATLRAAVVAASALEVSTTAFAEPPSSPLSEAAAAAAASSSPAPPLSSSVAVRSRAAQGLLETIGNTPLVGLRSLSQATGCRILAKCEHMGPGGSVKDRPAAHIITELERRGQLVPREARDAAGDARTFTIVEGTGGNTGVGMALVAAARGYKAVFTMPSNVAQSKIDVARAFGAEVIVCPMVPFSDARHYYHVAERLSRELPNAVWGNQFEGLDNSESHFRTTGPEIWRQAGKDVDGLVVAAGTGGTMGGLSRFLRSVNPRLAVWLIDPPGSSLAHYVETGEMAPAAGSTVTEGIGIGRLTANFASSAKIDGAFRGSNEEATAMCYYLLRREGIFVGPSAALNVVGAVKLARKLGPGHTVVTVLCDGGSRYMDKMYSPEWLKAQGLEAAADVDASRAHADFVL